MSSSAERVPLYYADDEYVKNGFFHNHPALVKAGLMCKRREVDGEQETALYLGTLLNDAKSFVLRTPHTIIDRPPYIYHKNALTDNRVARQKEVEKDGSIIYEINERDDYAGIFDYFLLHYERVKSESSDTWQQLAQKARDKMNASAAAIEQYWNECRNPFAPESYAVSVDKSPSPTLCDYQHASIELNTSCKLSGEHYADVYSGSAKMEASAIASEAAIFTGAGEGAIVKASVKLSGYGSMRDAAREDSYSPARVAHTINPILRVYALPEVWTNEYPLNGSLHAKHCDIPLQAINVPAPSYNELGYGVTVPYTTETQEISFAVPASRFIRFALMIGSENVFDEINSHLLDGVGPYAGFGKYENNVDSYFSANLSAEITILATDIGE
jgi:hypothetical protein